MAKSPEWSVVNGKVVNLALPERRPIPCQNMSKVERAATPLAFAEFLISLVNPVSVLWVMPGTIYQRFNLDLWDITRDANKYNGPGPIIAHPPCGPWGSLAWSSKESKHHGINAIELVHKYGGVVEQPANSQLFKQYGRPGARVITVNQYDYGHRALKPTRLYIVDSPQWTCC